MQKKYSKLIIFYVFCVCLIVTIGLSAAFFSSINNNESASTIYAKGGTMTVTYANGSGTITMENIYPREEAWVNKTFTVTGKNTTDLEMEYKVYLVISRNGFATGDLTYSISGTTTNSADTLISKANQPITKNGEILLGLGKFMSKNATHSYSLKLFYKETGEDQNNGQGQSFSGYVTINSLSSLAYNSLTSQTNNSGSESYVFNGPITKTQVEAVSFAATTSVPVNAIDSWDASEKLNNSVVAYTLDEDNNGLYELYIGQEDGVVASPDSRNLFNSYSSLKNIDLSNLDTSNITDMSYMFYYSSADELDVSNFDTSKVTNMK